MPVIILNGELQDRPSKELPSDEVLYADLEEVKGDGIERSEIF